MATVVSIRRPLNRFHRLVPVSISNSLGARSPLKSSPNRTAYVSPPVKLPRVGLLICSDRLPRGHTLLMEMYWSVPYLPPSYVGHLRDRPTPVSRTNPSYPLATCLHVHHVYKTAPDFHLCNKRSIMEYVRLLLPTVPRGTREFSATLI